VERLWIRVPLNALFVALSGLFLARCVVVIRHNLDSADCRIRCTFVGPQYYLSYEHGFVRRGLPGEVIRLLGGPAKVSIDAFGWRLTAAEVVAVVALAAIVFVQLRGSPLRFAAAALVLLSPLSAPLFLVDPGRYDAVGVVALLVIVLLGYLSAERRRPLLVGGVATATMVIAALSEEFLVLFLLVPAALVMSRHVESARRPRRAAVAIAAPIAIGFAVAISSTVTRPTQAEVDAIQLANGRTPSTFDAALFMRATIVSEARYVADHGLQQLLHTGLIWLAVSTLALLVLAGAYRLGGRWYWALTVSNACLVLAFSVLALDQRRWWTLAFLSQIAAVAIRYAHPPDDHDRPAQPRSLLVVGLALLVFVLLPQMFLVDPQEPSRFYELAIVGTLLAAVAVVGQTRGWWALRRVRGEETSGGAGDTTALVLAAPVVLLLALLFVSTAPWLVPLDYWRDSHNWSTIWSYWRHWTRY